MDTQTSQRELEERLQALIAGCGIKTAAIVTRDGALVTVQGDTGYCDVTALAALLGAMFSSTREVARLVGEEHFSILLQQGTRRHIHISLLSDAFLLACVFEDLSRLGMVRMQTARLAPRLKELASQGWQATAAPQGPTGQAPDQRTAEFREYALDLIDRIFAS